jgi:hypothetical protein
LRALRRESLAFSSMDHVFSPGVLPNNHCHHIST